MVFHTHKISFSMEDSSALSPISLLTIVIFLFILNLVMIIQDFSSSFPYPLHLVFSNAYILFMPTRNKKQNIDLSMIKRVFVPTRVDNKMSVEEVKAMIDDSEDVYERLIEEGEEYLLEKGEMMGNKKIVQEAFRLFDENQDGFIDEGELKHVLCLLGYDACTKMECRKMIKVFDENRDGKIDIYEFVKLIDKSSSSNNY